MNSETLFTKPEDDAAFAFADAYVDSFTSWDLLVFLYHRPDTEQTVDGLASVLGRSEDDLQRSLDSLCGSGAVQIIECDDAPACYRLGPDGSMRKGLAAFVQTCSRKDARLEMVRRVLARFGSP